MLTKTNYILWRECHKNAWLKVHKPDVYFAHELSAFEQQIIETGNEVELVARELYPTGVLVEGRGDEAVEQTKKLLESGEHTLFQAAFNHEDYFAAVDILKRDPDTGKFTIIEIKATNSVDKKTHFHDLAFQTVLLRKLGFDVEKTVLMHLNPDYIRTGDLELEKLFVDENLTEDIGNMSEEVEEEMHLAKDYLEKEDEPKGPCECVYKGRSAHCTTFNYSNPHVPEYSVHDLARIGLSKRKLVEFVDGDILHLHDIGDEIELSDIQKNQIWTHINDREIISREEVSNLLDELVFPLYFLDYETFPSALPRYRGFSPYSQIPFQYSLHVLESPEALPEHFDFLHTQDSDPSEAFAQALVDQLGKVGSVIVWHKSFECGRNRELRERLPQYKTFFSELESRIFDLEDFFKKQHYVHKDFRGSSSIKKVLPVLAPELSYKTLNIQEGGSAAQAWNELTGPNTDPAHKEELAQDLRDYCKLDTYAMYAVWKKLHELVN